MRVQSETQETWIHERQEAQMALINDYVRHTVDMLNCLCLSRHPGSFLSPIPSTTMPVIGQESKLAIPQHLAEKNNQDLNEAVHKLWMLQHMVVFFLEMLSQRCYHLPVCQYLTLIILLPALHLL